MHSALRYAMACSLMLLMLAAMGCGNDDDQASETESTNPDSGQPIKPGGGLSAPAVSGQPIDSGSPGQPSKPRVLIETTLGDITVELDREKADITVDEFLKNVRAKYYDKTIFHQVMKGYVVIGGTFTADREQKVVDRGPFYNEARDGMSNDRETIAMSRLPHLRNSATCQFFFNLADNSALLDHKKSPDGDTTDQDFGYCVFGKVVKGMDVVDLIGNAKVHDQDDFEAIPVEDILIESMRELR